MYLIISDITDIQRETLNGRCFTTDKTVAHFRRLNDLMEEYPFGPSNLFSSSNVDVWTPTNEPDRSYLLHTDLTGHLKMNKISAAKESEIFKHFLTRDAERKFRDEKLGRFSRVFGFSSSKNRDFVVLKYWEGVSVVKMTADGAEVNSVSRLDLTGRSVGDVTFVDAIDSYTVIDSSGSLTLIDTESDKIINRWKEAFAPQVTIQFNCTEV